MRQNLIAAALATQLQEAQPAGLAVVQLHGVEREVALRLAVKQAVRECGKELAQQLNDQLEIAIQRASGRSLGNMTIGEITEKLSVHPEDLGEQQRAAIEAAGSLAGEVYAWDGKPILHAGPIRVERYGDEGDERLKAVRTITLLAVE